MLKLKSALLVVSLALFMWPSVGFGQESYQWTKDNVYLSLNGGSTILTDVGFSSSASAYGVTVTAKGDFTFDNGPSISGTAGYIVDDLLRTEFEFGYSEWDYDQVVGTLDISVGGQSVSATGTLPVNGSIETLYGVATIIMTPFSGKNFTPLLGGSLGFVDIEDKVQSVSTLTVNGKEESTVLLAGVLAGFEYNLNKNFSVGVKYRHFWADSGQNGTEDATMHNMMGSLVYHF